MLVLSFFGGDMQNYSSLHCGVILAIVVLMAIAAVSFISAMGVNLFSLLFAWFAVSLMIFVAPAMLGLLCGPMIEDLLEEILPGE